MERYITADEAMHELEKVFMPDDFPKIVRAISSTRTAEVRLDVRGRWNVDEDGNIECSVCGHHGVGDLYCERCGAQMWVETIDIPDRKVGKWIAIKVGNGDTRYTCSECGQSYERDSREAWDFIYCPKCGAQMDNRRG